jgi:hypothetical protein
MRGDVSDSLGSALLWLSVANTSAPRRLLRGLDSVELGWSRSWNHLRVRVAGIALGKRLRWHVWRGRWWSLGERLSWG